MRPIPLSICAAQPPSSWLNRIGMASIKCVRPVLTTSFTDAALRRMTSQR